MDSVSLPVACSLMDSELQERRRNVLQKVRSAVAEVKEIDHIAFFGRLLMQRLVQLSQPQGISLTKKL